MIKLLEIQCLTLLIILSTIIAEKYTLEWKEKWNEKHKETNFQGLKQFSPQVPKYFEKNEHSKMRSCDTKSWETIKKKKTQRKKSEKKIQSENED